MRWPGSAACSVPPRLASPVCRHGYGDGTVWPWSRLNIWFVQCTPPTLAGDAVHALCFRTKFKLQVVLIRSSIKYLNFCWKSLWTDLNTFPARFGEPEDTTKISTRITERGIRSFCFPNVKVVRRGISVSVLVQGCSYTFKYLHVFTLAAFISLLQISLTGLIFSAKSALYSLLMNRCHPLPKKQSQDVLFSLRSLAAVSMP
jgi:hypothetical protein